MIEFESFNAAKAAIDALNGSEYLGLILKCDFAFVKSPLINTSTRSSYESEKDKYRKQQQQHQNNYQQQPFEARRRDSQEAYFDERSKSYASSSNSSSASDRDKRNDNINNFGDRNSSYNRHH